MDRHTLLQKCFVNSIIFTSFAGITTAMAYINNDPLFFVIGTVAFILNGLEVVYTKAEMDKKVDSTNDVK